MHRFIVIERLRRLSATSRTLLQRTSAQFFSKRSAWPKIWGLFGKNFFEFRSASFCVCACVSVSSLRAISKYVFSLRGQWLADGVASAGRRSCQQKFLRGRRTLRRRQKFFPNLKQALASRFRWFSEFVTIVLIIAGRAQLSSLNRQKRSVICISPERGEKLIRCVTCATSRKNYSSNILFTSLSSLVRS